MRERKSVNKLCMYITNIKALIVVLPMLFAGFMLAQLALKDTLPRKQIENWRNFFLAITIIGFMIPNFWLMLICISGAAYVFGAMEKSPPSIYLLLLCALPPTTLAIGGFGPINHLLSPSPQMVLGAALLIPCLFAGYRARRDNAAGTNTDLFFALYAALMVVLAFRGTTFTDGIRGALTFSLVTIPQYYVLSRWSKSYEDIKRITVAFVLALLALCMVTLPEFVMSWHVYAGVEQIWAYARDTTYISRGGFLRTYASLVNSITFGYVAMLALILSLPFVTQAKSKLWSGLVLFVFAVGLVTTFSRGPWMGAVIGSGLYVMLGPNGFSRSIRLGIAGFIGALLVSPTPIGTAIFEILPFVGGGEATGTIDYRQELFNVGSRVMLDHPWFGSEDYLQREDMQTLIQGQGIIDIVNSYLRIGLNSGFIGLGLFLGVQFSALFGLWKAMRRTRHLLPELSALCRAYFSALFAMLVVLATTSSVPPIDTLNFVIPALALAVHRVSITELAKLSAVPDGDTPTEPSSETIAPTKPKQKNKPVWEKSNTGGQRAIPKHLQQYTK